MMKKLYKSISIVIKGNDMITSFIKNKRFGVSSIGC